jgi:hypothetical protein
MKRNGVFKRIHNNPHKEGGPVLSDVQIKLTGAGTKKGISEAIMENKIQG